MRTRHLLVLACALVLFAAGCGRRGNIDPKAPIIIISMDTLRSDHLPAYGYTKVETPAIDQLSSDSILFERAYSQCPLTLVSHASLFTGLLPADHGIRDNLGYNLDPKAKTIAEMVKAKGTATGAAVSAVVLRAETGIKRGFEFWDDDIDIDPSFLSVGRTQRSGDATREIAEKWIGEHKSKPFLFFFHIYEPHAPYEPPEPFRSRYSGSPYDGEVATADDIVGKFATYLRQEGLYDPATIVLLSDHGEGLGDHGEAEHGILLYRETLQVPLFLKLPGQAQKGTRVAAPVQLIDVFPTIAAAFGDRRTFEGRSLLDVAAGRVTDDRSIYAETYYPRFHFGWNDLHSMIVGGNHYIHGPKPELYDIVRDPAETKDVLQESRRTYVALRERIKPFIRAASAPAAVDDEQKQQLIALGYVGSTVATAGETLPNPKENIWKANAIGQAFRLFRADQYEEALKATSALLRDNPKMLDMWMLQSRAQAKLNRRVEAIASAKEGLRVDPRSTSLAATIVTLSLELGQLDEAERHARLLVKETPNDAHRLLAQVALERKDYQRARAEATAVLGVKRDRPAALMLLGRVAQAEGKLDESLKLFDEALGLIATNRMHAIPRINYFRGDTLARLGRAEEAERAFLEEIRIFPDDPQAYRNLILLYTAEGKNGEATQLIFSLEKAAPTPPSYLAIAETLKIIGDVNGARIWAARGLTKFPADRQLRALLRG